jgi:hypothetical protein
MTVDETNPDEELIYTNGIDALTGHYLMPPISVRELAAMIRGQPVDHARTKEAGAIAQIYSKPSLGMPDGESPTNIQQAGWAVVFHKDEHEAVKKELGRLYEHRLKQIGDDKRVKILEYAGEQDWKKWLEKYKVSPGGIKPYRVPYYLLLVGGPERIPFQFSQLLSWEYGVGLLHFDHVEEYRQYVDSVIAYERGDAAARSKECVFFRTRGDKSTDLSADHLVAPLANGIPATDDDPAQEPVAESKGFMTRRIWDGNATGEALAGVFAPPATARLPAFLFTASHGFGFIQPDPQAQPGFQGALKCQDGIKFSASTLRSTPGVRVHGLIAFFFACYGAGTPQFDEYMLRADRAPLKIAEKPFIAALPKALLSHPEGGALACIGHIERAWNYSFSTRKLGDQLIPYQNAVKRILSGVPVGYALKDMRERHASLSGSIGYTLQQMRFGLQVKDQDLVLDWATRNDAGGYVVIGDPAVCLRRDRLI